MKSTWSREKPPHRIRADKSHKIEEQDRSSTGTMETSTTTTTSKKTEPSVGGTKRDERLISSQQRKDLAIGHVPRTKSAAATTTSSTANNVINRHLHRGSNLPSSSSSSTTSPRGRHMRQQQKQLSSANSSTSKARGRPRVFKGTSDDRSSSSQEMTTTSASVSLRSDATLSPFQDGSVIVEQETSLARPVLGDGETDDDECATLLESPSKQLTQVTSPNPQPQLCLDDEEINYPGPSDGNASRLSPRRLSSGETDENKDEYYEEDDFNELSNGAALTMADDDQITTIHSEDVSFVVYPLGCCEFDETQLVSTTSTRTIQKCILRLSNKPQVGESTCWGLDQSQPVLMRLLEDHIQFTDISTQTLLRSQPIQTIKTWAVDDDNTFAFVIEDSMQPQHPGEENAPLDYALLNGPAFMCYVFRSMDDDDMSCRVAAKLNEEITKYRGQLANRVSKSTRLQQTLMADEPRVGSNPVVHANDDQTTDLDAEDIDDLEDLEASNESSIAVKYIGKVQVPRPVGIDVLNIAIDKCLSEASNRLLLSAAGDSQQASEPPSTSSAPPIEALLHVSPSSVIVENVQTGEIIVECRIRYLTFMGISQRDIRWCGFIMQNTTNKSFVAHCFECYPTAGHVCEAIESSCSRMYEKMVRSQKSKRQQDAATNILPNSSKIRDTLAKTLSRIKLTPIL